MYEEQGVTVDRDASGSRSPAQMQQMVYDKFVYTQLVNEQYVACRTPRRGRASRRILNAYSKEYYTSPYKVS